MWDFFSLDNDSNFKGLLIQMNKPFNISFHLLTKRNTKGLAIELLYRVLDKATTISSDNRCVNLDYFVAVVGYNYICLKIVQLLMVHT